MQNLPPAALDVLLRSAPYETDGNGLLKGTYIFVYDHHLRYTEFLVAYPGSEFVGLAWLSSWEWHLNILGINLLLPHREIANTHQVSPTSVPKSPMKRKLVLRVTSSTSVQKLISTISILSIRCLHVYVVLESV
jgi:hypothetical protein